MEQMMRNFFLFLSKNKAMKNLGMKYGLRFGASRFVAGETFDKAARTIKELNQKGLAVTLDYLGEFVETEREAVERTNVMLQAIERIGIEQLNAQLSMKLTAVGLDISDELVVGNMRWVLDTAEKNSVFVTIDMEDYSRCQKTLDLFKLLKEEYSNVGTVLQAYLYRVINDVEDLSPFHPSLRLVKGAYKESADVAFPHKKDVDENFKKMIEKHLLNGNYAMVATHDERIIEYTLDLVKQKGIGMDQFEFQMLYGIRPERQLELAAEGFNVRVYVPFGTDWYGYFMRRLAERPANVLFVLKGILKK
jgi:proline dehydrogenase